MCNLFCTKMKFEHSSNLAKKLSTHIHITPWRHSTLTWYPGPDSNRHAFRREILSLLCLPFHHPGIILWWKPRKSNPSSHATCKATPYPSTAPITIHCIVSLWITIALLSFAFNVSTYMEHPSMLDPISLRTHKGP